MAETRKLRMLRRLVAFVVAVTAMVVLGSASHSLFVQQAWSNAAGLAYETPPAPIPLADRITWMAHDLVGMILPYSALTSIALLVAFLIAGALTRAGRFRMVVFGLAGASALFALFTIMKSVLGTVGVFGARGAPGLAAQMAVGAVAGLLFASVSRSR